MKKREKPVCPKCKSKNVIPIMYGLPTGEVAREEKEGKIKLGGCCVGENDPQWYCKECKTDF